MKANLVSPVIAVITLLFGATAMASAGHGKEDIGQPGVASEVTRTVDVEMGDVFFKPESWARNSLSTLEAETSVTPASSSITWA